MKLTEQHKQIILSFGFNEEDLPQIQKAVNNTKYTINNKRITAERALIMLGAEDFLSGISRSAFHYTAGRLTADGVNIHFDSSKIFKQ